MARASVLDLFGLVQSGASRMQQSVSEHLRVLSSTLATSPWETILHNAAVSSVSHFRSTFVQCPPKDFEVSSTPRKAATLVIDSKRCLQDLLINEVTFLVLSFLDGESLSRVQGVSTAWHVFIQQHRELIYRTLIKERRVFDEAINTSSSFQSYLGLLRYELDQELAHAHAVRPTHEILEHYCKYTDQHGFVAMFCDILEFRDPTIARAVARKRQSALSTVLVATPGHVMKFRKRSSYVGPITFVPIDNPLWPGVNTPPVNTPGFVGYAFDLVTMVEGYQPLKNTIVKSILKDLMIFDTTENAEAYANTIGQSPYAATLEIEGAQRYVGQLERANHLSFSTQLRRQLADKYPFADRIRRLKAKIKAVDNCIATAPGARNQY